VNTLAGSKQRTAAFLANPLLASSAILFIAILAAWSGTARATQHTPVSVSPNAAARAGAVSGVAPVLDPPASMRMHVGQTSDQALHATDADGDPLSFTKFLGPDYMTVTTTDAGSGSASGNIRLAPSLGDGGAAIGSVTVDDSYFYVLASFGIVVTPILDTPANMSVDEDTTADQRLTASDSDGHPLTFSLTSGPTFATVTTTSDSTGNIHLAPSFFDAGSYRATVSVTDGVAAHEVSLLITVRNVNRPPVLTQPADMHATVHTVTDQLLTASDPDGQILTFSKVAGPWYVWVNSQAPAPYVRLDYPSYGDTGTAVATVGVSDGAATDQKSFGIRVDFENNPPALNLSDIDIVEGTDVDQTFVAVDPDGQKLYFSASGVPRFVGVTAQPQRIGSDSMVVRVLLLPTYDDAGIYRLAFRISDGWDAVTDTLKVTVRNAYPGETSLRLWRAQGPDSTLEYEYSAVDGVYGVSSTASDRVTLNFQSTSGSGARWAITFVAPQGSPLAVGDYTTVGPGSAAFSITGSDSTVPALMGCAQGTARFQIRRVVRRLDGSILSFWGAFQQMCADLTPGLGGEVRYQVQQIPITLVAARWLAAKANERFLFRVSAVDTAADAIALSASGLPTGASFLDFGNGQGTFGWIPTRDQVGLYLIRTTATSAGGLADTALTLIRLQYLNHAPEPHANGPYTGTIGEPLPFSSNGSGDQDGDSLSYFWTFGDGGIAQGPSPSHIYRAIGTYPVALIASDGVLSAVDYTLARISWPDSARAFEARSATPQASGPLRLQAGGGRFCVAVEIVDAPTSILDFDRFSFRMEAKGLGSVDAISADPTRFDLGDADRNGIPDVTACFTREALRRLFDKVSGRLRVDASVGFSLLNGHGFRAPLSLEVMGPDGLEVLMAPNPFRNAGMFSFVTTRVGAARLTLFDARGRPVRTPLDTESLPIGYHDIPIDARGEDGTELSSGVYFYRLQTLEGTRTGRMAILK